MHTHRFVLIEISMEIGMLNFWLGLLVTAMMKETYFSIPHFKGLGMRNLQYQIRSCQNSHNSVTNHNYILCVVQILMKQTLFNIIVAKEFAIRTPWIWMTSPSHWPAHNSRMAGMSKFSLIIMFQSYYQKINF